MYFRLPRIFIARAYPSSAQHILISRASTCLLFATDKHTKIAPIVVKFILGVKSFLKAILLLPKIDKYLTEEHLSELS